MKNQYKKTFIGSIAAFIVGTSCCWLSSLAIWFGGAAFMTGVVGFVESTQVQFLIASVVLLVLSLYFFHRSRTAGN